MPWVEIRGETEQAYRDEIDRERYVRVRERGGGREGARNRLRNTELP